MLFRTAINEDIPRMQIVRNAVKENVLSDPALVPGRDYVEFINVRGKGWVCEVDGNIAGFAIADLRENNIWALFILPDYEGKGIGKKLHTIMLDWYFSKTKKTVWLGTAFHTRAEKFYRLQGWKQTGLHGAKEIKFEMSSDSWHFHRKEKSSKEVSQR